jgi:uncharacterized membrane protein
MNKVFKVFCPISAGVTYIIAVISVFERDYSCAAFSLLLSFVLYQLYKDMLEFE